MLIIVTDLDNGHVHVHHVHYAHSYMGRKQVYDSIIIEWKGHTVACECDIRFT